MTATPVADTQFDCPFCRGTITERRTKQGFLRARCDGCAFRHAGDTSVEGFLSAAREWSPS